MIVVLFGTDANPWSVPLSTATSTRLPRFSNPIPVSAVSLLSRDRARRSGPGTGGEPRANASGIESGIVLQDCPSNQLQTLPCARQLNEC